MRSKASTTLLFAASTFATTLLLVDFPSGIYVWASAFFIYLAVQLRIAITRSSRESVSTARLSRTVLALGAASYAFVDSRLTPAALAAIFLYTFLGAYGDRFLPEIAQHAPIAVNLPNFNSAMDAPRIQLHSVEVFFSVLLVLSPGALLFSALFPVNTVVWSLSWAIFTIALGLTNLFYLRSFSKRLKKCKTEDYENLPSALAEYAPTFAVHWDAPATSLYQLNMWLPYLTNLDTRFVVFVRPVSGRSAVINAAGIETPLLFTPRHHELERVLVPSIETVFYVNNADRNNQLLRFTNIKHIQLGHGDSEKTTSTGPVFRMFDKVFVAGEAAVDRFTTHDPEIRKEKFEIVGRPQLSEVQPQKQPINAVSCPTLLYAPTWNGDFTDSAYSSLPYIKPLIRYFLNNGCRVIFRSHPFTTRHASTLKAAKDIQALLKTHRAETGVEHLIGYESEQKRSLVECFNESDALLTDVSSVLTDYLASNKPIAIYEVPEIPKTSSANEGIYQFTSDQSTWANILQDFLREDSLKNQRDTRRSYFLGTSDPIATFTKAALAAMTNSSNSSQVA